MPDVDILSPLGRSSLEAFVKLEGNDAVLAEQTPFDAVRFSENPEPRVPCVLLLDTSGSMKGRPIEELNAGLLAYHETLSSDSLASRRVEIAVVTFGGSADVIHDFSTSDRFHPPTLQARGNTPMGQAIRLGIGMVVNRKQTYKDHGIAYYQPWIVLITDGHPTDEWTSAAELLKREEEQKQLAFFAIGIEGADFEILAQIGTRGPRKLKGTNFRELFLWLSQSQAMVSRSNPGDKVPLPAPTWAEV